jgi:hypothetical protein
MFYFLCLGKADISPKNIVLNVLYVITCSLGYVAFVSENIGYISDILIFV